MEDNQPTILEGEITGARFSLASNHEICTASVSDCAISHSSQLSNPFLGLPLEFGKCESCGTAEPGKCEGHFGYIQLPIPIYHPSHVSELKKILSLLCLKCLKLKQNKSSAKSAGVAERLLSSCCEDASLVSIRDVKTTDGACYLELKFPRSRLRDDSWKFLEKYGFRYGGSHVRTLLPCEVLEIFKKIPVQTRKKLAEKGHLIQDGYILQYIPVPPNCLSVPDVSDGVSVMSSDLSMSMLKKVLRQIEIIRTSRSGTPNFESHEVEANELQIAVDEYLQIRGTAKVSRDVDTRFGIRREQSLSSTKAWLEKIKTLFISKGSGFSSRTVITGDTFRGVNEVGIPCDIAQRITFEEKVNVHNINYLQDLVDNKLCLTFRDGSSTYSLREGSKGHTVLRPGQVVHRRIMDGDLVFLNRPPTTHKHSLQALKVYVHEDHTVKINPLICGPLGADFDGDAVHLFYPQSLPAKAEALELFSLEKQLLSSHTDNLLIQLATDSMLSLKILLKSYFLDKAATQQLAMFVPSIMPQPTIFKANGFGPCWTGLQILQSSFPAHFDCSGEQYLIRKGIILKLDYDRDVLQSMINEIATSIFFEKGPESVLKFFDSLQPLLMEYLFAAGFSVSLEDYSISKDVIQSIQKEIQVITPLLSQLRSKYNELLELQLESHIKKLKVPISSFISNSSALGNLIDSKKDSDINKVAQQIGFLGLQLSDRGKFYSKTLVEDVASLFHSRYSFTAVDSPCTKYGLVNNCYIHGLDPYEEIVHSISAREVMVRSSRGLSEPGTLFKNLMAILRDVVICYDGTVRNVCSNSVIQFEYGLKQGIESHSLYPPGEPVGVLAATAMSTPAYKAVLDSSSSSNSSWEMMKEILLCKVGFKNELTDRRVILLLNECSCGRNYCQEKAALSVMNHLKKVSLKDAAVKFTIDYRQERTMSKNSENDAGLVGCIHLNKSILENLNLSMLEISERCEEKISSLKKNKKLGSIFRRTVLNVSESFPFEQPSEDESLDAPCLMFFWQEFGDIDLEKNMHILSSIIFPVLLETIIKGDPRISSANITWISLGTTTYIRNNSSSQRGELALDVVLEGSAIKQSGDAWRVVLDSCLPVLHLIDTQRSIPYAIKQVQELFGISSAFDQAVQRLSSSVSKVTKGILKEHLILLASSMSCSGNLLGFNIAGFKALSRSLNVQAPFTDATLYTPRRCFERAAEKCHVDSLSSIVSSCSWGKPVTVGTGSRFDILWDKEQMRPDQEDTIDVYGFLQMVRSTPNGEELNTSCLGEDIDDLIEDEFAEFWAQSPEQNDAADKPVFEDTDEYNLENKILDGGKSWNSSWDLGIEKSGQLEECGWGAPKSDNTTASTKKWGLDKNEPQVADTENRGVWSAWSNNKNETTDKETSKGEGAWYDDKMGTSTSDDNVKSSWGIGKSGLWDAVTKQTSNPSNWEGRTDDQPSAEVLGGWGAEDVGKITEKANVTSSWGTNIAESWGAGAEKSNTLSSWEHNATRGDGSPTEQQGRWVSENARKSTPKGNISSNWNNNNNAGTYNQPSGLQKGELGAEAEETSGAKADDSSEKWDASSTKDQGVNVKDRSWSAWNTEKAGEQKDNSEKTEGWGILSGSDQLANQQGSDSFTADGWNSSGKKYKWGPRSGEASNKNQPEGSQGWGSKPGDWKSKKDRPVNSSIAGGIFTATRQRLDAFTSEEQCILLEVEPIMKSIRNIKSKYNDGDPLSAEDQSYIVDSVFIHHPQKTVKMGVGIDHIEVGRHEKFPDSRCFFIVSPDGNREDFSVRKCLDNFIRNKYPDMAETFIDKYFQKPSFAGRPRQNVSKETESENTGL